MMLRVLVVLLLLANGLLWAWTQGALPGLGPAPAEVAAKAPEARQVRPEALMVLPLSDVRARAGTADEPQAPARVPGAEAAGTTAQAAGAQEGVDDAADSAPDAADTQAAAPAEFAEPPAAAPTSQLPEERPSPDATQAGSSERLLPDEAAAGEAGADDAVLDSAVPWVDAGPLDAAPAGHVLPGTITPEAAARSSCWQAGPFDAAQAQRLREAAAVLPSGSWELQQTGSQAPRWMIYLGDMEDELDALATRAELQARGLDVDRAGPGFEPGLSLGRYSSPDAAESALQMLGAQADISGARVVQERVEEATFFLRAESTDPGLRQRLRALPLAGRSLRRCR